MSKALLNSKFSSEEQLIDYLPQLGEQGYKLIGFGRYQPLHHGHKSLFDTAMALTGIGPENFHVILNNKARLVNGEKNPFNARQRKEMFKLAFPEVPSNNIGAVRVYLGGGGDIGTDIDILRSAIGNCAEDRSKAVLVYFEKEEDRHPYIVNSNLIDDTHYAHLVAHPEGPHVLKITENMINRVSKYVPIDAKMFRKNLKDGAEEVAYELLPQCVADYVKEQYRMAGEKCVEVGDLYRADPLPIYRQSAQQIAQTVSRASKESAERPKTVNCNKEILGLGLGSKN